MRNDNRRPRFVGLILACLIILFSSHTSLGQENPTALSPGVTLKRTIKGGATQSFQISVEAGQFLHLQVEQLGVDVTLSLDAPDGQLADQCENLNRIYGYEKIYYEAKRSGVFQVRVFAREPNTQGSFSLTLREQRPVTKTDLDFIAAVNEFRAKEPADYVQLGAEETQKKKERFEALLPPLLAFHDKWMASGVYERIAQVHLQLGTYQAGVSALEKAIELGETTGDREAIAFFLNTLGTIYSNTGDFSKAFECFEKIIVYGRATNQPLWVAYALINSGSIREATGERLEALDAFKKALIAFREGGDLGGQGQCLTHLAALYIHWGESQQGIEYSLESIAITKKLNLPLYEAYALNRHGGFLTQTKRYAEAIPFHQQAGVLMKSVGYPNGVVTSLIGVGNAYKGTGDREKAFEAFQDARIAAQDAKDEFLEANVIFNLGVSQAEFGLSGPAEASFRKTLETFDKLGNRERNRLAVLKSLGTLKWKSGDVQAGRAIFNQNRTLARTLGLPEEEADAFWNIARFEREEGELARSREAIESAISIVEQIRADLKSRDAQVTLFAVTQGYYSFYAETLLMEGGLNERTAGLAFSAVERGRARTFQEILVESRSGIRNGVAPNLLARERDLSKRIASKSESLLRAGEPGRQSLRQEIDGLISELDQVQSEIIRKSPGYAALTRPIPLTTAEIQSRLLDDETTLLSFSLGTTDGFAWVITREKIEVVNLGPKTEIEVAATAYSERVTGKPGSSGELDAAAEKLSRLILQPIGGRLRSKRIFIVPDGPLFYVPFAALPLFDKTGHPGRFLVEEHEIAILPSASSLVALREGNQRDKPREGAVIAFANPVFSADDPRVTLPNQSGRSLPNITQSSGERFLSAFGAMLPPVPKTGEQARAIASIAGPSRCFIAENFTANKEMAASPRVSGFRIVHFATHGIYDDEHPEFSGLALSLVDEKGQPRDGFLLTPEIYNLPLNADLVVLSACRTGNGKRVRGEGVIGMTRAFMYAGTPRVISTLWDVGETASTELMKRFYRRLYDKARPMRPAEALRAAQIEMLRDPRWKSPIHWGAFQFQGELR